MFDFLSAAHVHPAECLIKVDGAEIADLYPYVTTVTVDASRLMETRGTITFASPADENDHWLVADHPRLRPGASFVIEADFTDAREEIVRGVIQAVSPSFPSNAGEAQVSVELRDDGARLDNEPRVAVHGTPPAGTTDLAILTSFLSGTGLVPHPQCGMGLSGLVLHQRTTDLQLLRDRAASNGYDLQFERGQVYFGPMRLTGLSQPTILAYAGQATNCRSFAPHNGNEHARQQRLMGRDAHGDPTRERTIDSDAAELGTQPSRMATAQVRSRQRHDRYTTSSDDENQARARRSAVDGHFNIQAEGEVDGALYGHVLLPGHPVDIDGVGDMYSGTYFVDSVTHRFDVHGYSQKFRVCRNALGRSPAPPVSRLAGVLGR